MRLNRLEFALMNNPVRAAVQRRLEAGVLLRMGGLVRGGSALEVGCGRGVGIEVIFDRFGADRVDGFDLDPRMVERARRRLAGRAGIIRVWVGDATAIAAPAASYDAVFDFGVIHHVPRWRKALAEISRVLKPRGRLYAEEVLEPLIRRSRHLLRHPQQNRFGAAEFGAALVEVGLRPLSSREVGNVFAWFVARKNE